MQQRDPSRVIVVFDIDHVAISGDASAGAVIGIKVQDEPNIDLWLSAETIAKLQAMLTKADIEHAKLQPKQ